MTSLTDTQVVTASGGLVELGYSQITAAATIGTTATQLIPASGSLTVVCDGSPVLVEVSIPYVTTNASSNTRIGITVDGVQNQLGIFSPNAFVPGQFKYRLTPSAGSHTFSVYGYSDTTTTMGAGAASGSGAYVPAFLRVSKIVQATQWPAVTTGTIIATSSTRPASPFEGQVIYETDTGLTRYYDGAAWEDTAAATRPHHAEVYLASNISYPRATSLEWTHLREDNTGGAWAASPNPERLVFPADGMYLCVANMRWDVGSGNDSTQTSMSVVGGLGTVTNVGYAVNGTSVSEILTTVAVVSAGDYLVVGCFNKPAGGSPFTCVAGSFMSFTQLSAVPT